MKRIAMRSVARKVLPLVIAGAVTVSLISGIKLRRNEVTLNAQAKESFTGIEKIRTDIGDGQNFHILEVTPKADDEHTWVGGQFGYLVSGSEPADIENTLPSMYGALDSTSGHDRRSSYANTLLNGLVSAGIASTGEDSAPLKVTKVSDTSGSEYYRELWPWESDSKGQKELTLDSDDSVTLKNATAVEKQGGAYNSAGSDAYVASKGGGYIQRTTEDNPYETLDSAFDSEDTFQAEKDRYVFYNLSIQTYDDTSAIPDGMIIFSKDRNDPDASWEYDYLATERRLFNANADYAAGDDYVSDPCMGSGITDRTLEDLKNDTQSSADTGGVQSFWCVRLILDEKPFVKVAEGEDSYFAFSSATFRYVGNGNGDYDITGADATNIVESGAEDGDVTITFNTIRYVGGYTNNNWFLRHTLDYDTDDITDDVRSKVMVDYVSPDQVTSGSNDNGQSLKFSDYDLVVLSAGFDPTADSPSFGYMSDAYDDVKADSALAEGLKTWLNEKNPLVCDACALGDRAFGGKNKNPLYNHNGVDRSASVASSQYGLVQNSVYVYKDNTYGDEKYYTMASSEYADSFDETQYRNEGLAFYDVYNDIVYENSIRKQNHDTELLDDAVGEAQTIRYIINYRNKRPRVKKDSIRVLDLEPENVKYYKGNNSTAKFKTDRIMPLVKAGGYSADQVEVVTMTTNTLAGLTDEISESYDMVYIGDNRGQRKNFRTDGMNYTDENGKLDGLVYYNIGGQYWNRNSALNVLTGYLDSDYDLSRQQKYTWNSYRYPGNDISKKKAAQLNAFISQGKPVIIDDDLLDKDDTTGTYSVSKKTVDANTRLYELLQKNLPDHTNIMRESDADEAGTELANYLAVSSPHLNMISEPEAYNERNPYAHVIGGNDAYADGVRKEGTKKLDFRFQIINETELSPDDTTYNVSVYADLNSDGVFKDSEEITETTVKRDGSQIPSDELTGNISESSAPQIEVSAVLPESLQGVVTWKIVVEKNANEANGEIADNMTRCSAKGVSFVGLNDRSKKIKIRVLQICALPDMFKTTANNNNYWSVALWSGVEAMEISGTTSSAGIGTPELWKYLKTAGNTTPAIDDYDIDVDCVRGINGAYKLMKGESRNVHRNAVNVTIDDNWADHYDMLLLGLSDVYGHFVSNPQNSMSEYDPKVAYVYKQIADFIDDGKSVLFGHDNVFWCSINRGNTAGRTLYNYCNSASQNIWQWSTNWQTGFTDMIRILRTKAHMDLYGISDTTTTISADGSNEHLGGTTFWNSNGDNTIRESGILASRPDNLSNNEISQITKTTDYSIAYKPVTGGDRHANGTVSEVQGFSNATAKRIMHNIDPLCNAKADSNKYTGWTGSQDADLINPYINQHNGRGWRAFGHETLSADDREASLEDSTNVDQVSKGQITTYPYNINKGDFQNSFNYSGNAAGIRVSPVHGQWYTLNTNTDDINVWYTVEDTGDPRGYGYYDHNDCVNDYYIYNCGNITYTGAGHSGLDHVTTEEAKLFVNTIIASYRVSATRPEAEFVTDAEGTSTADSISINTYSDPDYGTYKDQNTGETRTDEYAASNRKKENLTSAINDRKIYFRITDENIAGSKTFKAEFFKKAQKNTEVSDGTEYTTYTVDDCDRLSSLKIYDAGTDTEVSADKLKSRTVYYIRLVETDDVVNELLNNGSKNTQIYLRPSVMAGSKSLKGDVVKLDINLTESKLFAIG